LEKRIDPKSRTQRLPVESALPSTHFSNVPEPYPISGALSSICLWFDRVLFWSAGARPQSFPAFAGEEGTRRKAAGR
jgi:hypothetical protein